MHIAGLSARPPHPDAAAAALTGATRLLGQRPAVTALGSGGRSEQGFASLAGWVAKSANLLTLELGVGPGDRVAVAGPAGWPLAAITLSAWWVGATVVPVTSMASAHAAVLHTSVRADDVPGDVLWFGDALDGTGEETGSGEQWTEAVTPHGDRPPTPAGDGDLTALLDVAGDAHSQRALLGPLADDRGGVLGVVRDGDEDVVMRPDAARLIAAITLRPLVTGAATVIIAADDPDRDAHERAERIGRWFD